MINSKNLEYQVLPIPFYTLTLCGVWCPRNAQSLFKHVYSYFTIFVIILQVLLTVEVFIHVIIAVWKNEFDLGDFFVFTSLVVGLFKGLNIWLYRKCIVEFLSRGFQEHWRVPKDDVEKTILITNSSKGRRIQLIYALSCLAGVSIKIIGPLMKSNSAVELPTPAWYSYDINKPIYFWLSYVQQMFVGAAIILMHIGMDTILSGLMIQLCVQLKLLKHRLRNFYQLVKCAETRLHRSSTRLSIENELIKQYINDHQFIYGYAKTLNNYFFGWLLSLLIVVLPNICINVYLISISEVKMDIDFITSVGLFAISLFQIYLPCWYGNEVMINSLEIRSAVYEMDWVNFTPNLRKILIIMMIRAAEPIQINVAHIINMCIKTFLNIMKTSYSVVSVLQQM